MTSSPKIATTPRLCLKGSCLNTPTSQTEPPPLFLATPPLCQPISLVAFRTGLPLALYYCQFIRSSLIMSFIDITSNITVMLMTLSFMFHSKPPTPIVLLPLRPAKLIYKDRIEFLQLNTDNSEILLFGPFSSRSPGLSQKSLYCL